LQIALLGVIEQVDILKTLAAEHMICPDAGKAGN
jgi:hypothetical protein